MPELRKRPVFLKAEWEYLAMFNYVVPPEVLLPHLPIYTTLDLFEGKALVSVVGFLFNNTTVLGVRWPWHINFEEVNLRYYISHKDERGEKRGVGFVSEIVPRACIATMANQLYNEHYSTAKMDHVLQVTDELIEVEYHWQQKSTGTHKMSLKAENNLTDILPGSEAEFILEHYYGYNQLNEKTTIEYGVEHPRWQIFPVTEYKLDCDVAALYGKEFVPFIQHQEPHSVFLAKGSEVIVRKPVYLKK